MTNIFIDTNFFVYMNTPTDRFDDYSSYFEEAVRDNRVFTNMIVIDELLFVSKGKYKVPYSVTLDIIDSLIFPFASILPLDESDYETMKEMLKYCSKPSDALIVASMRRANIDVIVSEDRDFDKVPSSERRWIRE